jgi:hypothetical protein
VRVVQLARCDPVSGKDPEKPGSPTRLSVQQRRLVTCCTLDAKGSEKGF